ncbi:unnamed protein product [Paramecium primaurelia]|uniref:Uncharacterized protein n=1 Tax=Paramecium primaurelia TaxID=5886 RepID=A0A8S1QLQ9_PARPR|nr:unnamed protein product [Paramecium primaurelia]
MRKNYNKKLNEISEKLILEQLLSIEGSKDTKKIKKVTIQAVEDEQLLKDSKQLIEKQKVTQNQSITIQKSRINIQKRN